MNGVSFNPMQLALKPILDKAIAEDNLFAEQVKTKTESKKKSWEECCEYIMGEAYKYASEHKSGNFGLAFGSEADMLSMVKHYYDEDDIKINKVGGKAEVKVATTKTATKPTIAKPKADNAPTPTTKVVATEATPKPLSKKEVKHQADMTANGDLFSEFFS